jgi:hypothetical protein
VFSDPLTAELKPTSNGETKAQRGMISEVPAIRGGLNFDFESTPSARMMRLHRRHNFGSSAHLVILSSAIDWV